MRKRDMVVIKGLALFFFATTLACGGSGSSSSTTTADTTVSKSVPGDLVVSSPTATTSASTSVSSRLVKAEVGDASSDDFAAKRTALQNLLTGSDTCSFTPSIPDISGAQCYGPSINYTGHPDASGGISPDGQLPSGDTGLWDETEGSTQACAAAKMTEVVEKVANKVDNMTSLFATVSCAGRKAGLALPAIGASTDLTTALAAHVSISLITFNSATLERLANDSDGNEVYKITLNVTLNFPVGSQTAVVILKHVPTAADNSTYKGKLSMRMSSATSTGMNCPSINSAVGQTGSTHAGVIFYEKASSTSMTYEMKFAEFCGNSTNPFDSNNNIDLADTANEQNPSSNPDGWADNGNYMIASINPTNGIGTVAYAWQAGSQDGRTRTLNVTLTEASDGSASGTAYAGYGPDLSATTGLGGINGFFCAWTGPGAPANKTTSDDVDKAQRQGLTRAAGATEFTSVSADLAIRFAPTSSCDAGASDGFTYSAVSDGPFDNDRSSDAAAVTSNLIDLTSVSFTLPTAPADVGG